jgi:hypothetical protein
VPVSISYADLNNYPSHHTGVVRVFDASQRGLTSRAIGCALLRMLQAMAATLHRKEQSMLDALDVILLALGLGFFALSIAYVYACDRL